MVVRRERGGKGVEKGGGKKGGEGEQGGHGEGVKGGTWRSRRVAQAAAAAITTSLSRIRVCSFIQSVQIIIHC